MTDRIVLQNAQRVLRDGDLAAAQMFIEAALIDPDAPRGPQPLDLRALAETDPQPPRFVVEGWMPQGQVTLLAGHGGSGKSLIALTAAICIATGRAFFGLRVERRRVLFLSFEDSVEVLHWRLRRICDMLGVELGALAGWLFIYDATDRGEPLYIETRDGHGTTPAFDWLRERVAEHGAQVLMIDGTADAFAGNENARAQVRGFLQGLRRALPRDGAALLLHHVDALSAHSASSKGYSGSTAWHNSCRARWHLKPADEGEQADPSRVVLELRKSNHGKPGATLALRFSEPNGCFVAECESITSPLDRALRESDERAAVLAMIRAADAAGDPIPAATGGTRTAHSVAKMRPDYPATLRGKSGRARFFDHVEALRQAGAVRIGEQRYGKRNSREVLHAA